METSATCIPDETSDLEDIEDISWHDDDGLLGGGLEMLDCRWIPI